MTTASENANFIDNVIENSLLENSIEWIGNNMAPEDVFEPKDLENWAEGNGYVKGEEG